MKMHQHTHRIETKIRPLVKARQTRFIVLTQSTAIHVQAGSHCLIFITSKCYTHSANLLQPLKVGMSLVGIGWKAIMRQISKEADTDVKK